MLALLVVAASARPQPRRVAQATVFSATRRSAHSNHAAILQQGTRLAHSVPWPARVGVRRRPNRWRARRRPAERRFWPPGAPLLCLCCSCVSYACRRRPFRAPRCSCCSAGCRRASRQTTTTWRLCATAPRRRSARAGSCCACSALGYAAGPLAGGALAERHGAVATTIVAAASFAIAAPAVVGALDETRPAPTASGRAVERVASARLRAALLRFALRAALVYTVVAQPLLAQHLGLRRWAGRLSSVQGLAAAFFSTAWLPPLLGRGWLTERRRSSPPALVLVPSAYLAWRPSMVGLALPATARARRLAAAR